MPLIPNTSTPGLFLVSLGNGQNGSRWVGGNSGTIRISQTYSVQGLIAVPSGATNYLPPFFMPVPSGQTVNFVGVRAVLRSATSVTIDVEQNGSGITGLTALSVTTSATTTAPTSVTAVADGDAFAIVVSAISGTPDGLSLSFYFDVTP